MTNGSHARCLRRFLREYNRQRRAVIGNMKKLHERYVPRRGDEFVATQNGASHRFSPFTCASVSSAYVEAVDASGDLWKLKLSVWDFARV